MSPQTAIDFGRWVLTIGVTICFVGINIKTKWWRTGTGINVFCLVTTFFFTAVVINLAAFDIIGGVAQVWVFAGIYVLFGIVLAWRGFTIWMLNEHFWAWTKDVPDGD